MDRLSFSLTDQQMGWLQRQARQLGISIGELLRRIIDEKRAAAAEAPQQRP